MNSGRGIKASVYPKKKKENPRSDDGAISTTIIAIKKNPKSKLRERHC